MIIDVRDLPQAKKIIVAAPVNVGKEAKQKYYVGVMLFHDVNTKRLYLHEAVEEKEITLLSDEDTWTKTGPSENNDNLYTSIILKKALNVKAEEKEISSGRRDALPEEEFTSSTLESVAPNTIHGRG